jgi:NAD(P)-dependent dehydrogenase (short-subunit alcohol dehydrogenase family)
MGSFLVTGAASGIGLATARVLAREGHRVFALDRDEERLASAFDGLDGLDGPAPEPLVADVGDPGSVAAALETVTELTTTLDGLVNAAGIVLIVPFEDLTAEDWERIYRVNVVGTFLVLQAALPLLRAAASPAVVNIASMAGKIASSYTAPYNASKAAVISLTRSAALTLAPDIRVNAVCPGIVDTPMYEQIDRRMAEVGAPEEFRFHRRAPKAPLGRAATADEIASVIVFLLGPGAAFMTGEDVNVTGGFVMH